MLNRKTWLPPPRDVLANIAYRKEWLAKARDNAALQRDIKERCRRDIDFFLSGWCLTYSPKDSGKNPLIPWISYPFQVGAAEQIDAALGAHDVGILKSRDQGASTLILYLLVRQWLLFEMRSFLIGSRKQDLVDKTGYPGSLMWKIDLCLKYLPAWMRPSQHRILLHLENFDNGSVIDGEAAVGDFARGDRRTAILLDEFAAVSDAYSILNATRDATSCRIFNSTPQGASGAYYDTIKQIEKAHPDWLIRMHWSQHPLRNKGLYTTHDKQENGQLLILDEKYEFPAGYTFVRDGRLRSPWYDEQCSRAANQIEINAELDCMWEESSWQYFSAKVIADLVAEMARNPFHTGELSFRHRGHDPMFSPEAHGRLKVWCSLDGKGNPPKGDYVIGCDVATGSGGDWSSNSVACVADRRTGNKVAQFTGNTIEPYEFGGYAEALCRWFESEGGRPAFLIWEAQGPGQEFEKRITDDGFTHVFQREQTAIFGPKKLNKIGWWSSEEAKRQLLTAYKQALMLRLYSNPCKEALLECTQYIHFQDGSIEHARSKTAIDPTAKGKNHGDMVLADALTYKGMCDRGFNPTLDDDDPEAGKIETIPIGSFLWRRNEAEKIRKRQARY